MNDRHRENPGKLFERFFDREQAAGFLEDVRETEVIFRKYASPEPGDLLIANIKAEIAMRLPVVRARLARHRIYRRIAVAAAIVIIATISTMLLNENSTQPQGRVPASLIPTSIWESNDIAADDAKLAAFAAEVELIESEVRSLEYGDGVRDRSRTLEELEIEVILVSSDFWKE